MSHAPQKSEFTRLEENNSEENNIKKLQKAIDKRDGMYYNTCVVEPQTAGYSKSTRFPAEEKLDEFV